MKDLERSLAQIGSARLIASDEAVVSANDVLQDAAELERSIELRAGMRMLSLDESPVTLLALLTLAERHSIELLLGRGSIQSDLRTAGPDVTIRPAKQIEKLARDRSSEARYDEPSAILLLTSGTTGAPKIVHQTLPALLGRVRTAALDKNRAASWLLTYEGHSFAGLQVILSAALSGGVLVAPPGRTPAQLVHTAAKQHVTHISGTPTFWRAFLMTLGGSTNDSKLPSLRQVTIGGEAVDQATLDRLSAAFPQARISHIYASTEAGSLFAVHDKRAGFPGEWLDRELPGGIRLRRRDGELEVFSPRRMQAYASGEATPFAPDGWLTTGDLIEAEGDRIQFRGRRDQVVNVAGLKVFPQEVEAFLLSQPSVADARVLAVESPLTGALLTAQIVFSESADRQNALAELRSFCSRNLPRHKLPRRFEVIESIPMSASGKKVLT